MLAVDFYRIHPDQVARLKEWMAEITTRRNEALETYVQEGVRHEMGHLIEGREGPMLVWVKQVMRQVVAEWIKPQVLYECLVSKV